MIHSFRLTVLALFAAGSHVLASSEDHAPEVVPGEIIVKLEPEGSLAGLMIRNQFRGSLVTRDDSQNVELLSFTDRAAYVKALEAFRASPYTVIAEPNYIARTMMTPNDPNFNNQWGPKKIFGPQAWDIVQGSANVRIAILDTGVDPNHPDLKPKLVAGYNWLSENTNWADDNGHGTHVAGIAAAATNNGIGIAGIGFNCTILPVKVLSSSGTGTSYAIGQGIRWAADQGAKVINLSLGGSAASSFIQSAVDYAWQKGSVIVAAAGNSGNTTKMYPAAFDNVIAVGATTSSDGRASFSNYGNWVDVAAPGSSIHSTMRGNKYGNMSGTSMAAPHVAGQAGLLWAYLGTSTAPSVVRERIQNTADPVGSWVVHGRINLSKGFEGSTGVSEEFTARSLSLGKGVRRNGNLASLAVQDSNHYIVESTTNGSISSLHFTATVRLETSMSVKSLDIAWRQSSTASAEDKIQVYNFRTKKWEEHGVNTVTSSMKTFTYRLNGPLNDYISSNRDVQIRLVHRRSGSAAFRINTDLVRVTAHSN
jgi:thermitase